MKKISFSLKFYYKTIQNGFKPNFTNFSSYKPFEFELRKTKIFLKSNGSWQQVLRKKYLGHVWLKNWIKEVKWNYMIESSEVKVKSNYVIYLLFGWKLNKR